MAKLHQIFIGCPFSKDIRRNYDRLKKDIEQKTPLSLILADTVGVSSSDYLLEHITESIRESAGCIFDVTNNNPNVSLEVGIAHTMPVEFVISLKTRKPRKQSKGSGKDAEMRSIISDLQGKNRIEYKTYDSLRDDIEKRFFVNIPYMHRWRQFEKENQSMVAHVLKLFNDIRTSGKTTRARLVSALEGSGFSMNYVVKQLRKHKLVSFKTGKSGGIYYPSK